MEVRTREEAGRSALGQIKLWRAETNILSRDIGWFILKIPEDLSDLIPIKIRIL